MNYISIKYVQTFSEKTQSEMAYNPLTKIWKMDIEGIETGNPA